MVPTPTRLVSLALFTAILAACASSPVPTDITRWSSLHRWSLDESVKAFAVASDGEFALLSYKGAQDEAKTAIQRFNLSTGNSETIQVVRGSDGVMFRAVAEAQAIALHGDGSTFLANWPAYLARVDSRSGELQALTSIADAGHGMTSFNVLSFSSDGSAAFGLGADLVRIDVTNGKLAYQRDMPVGGGRSLAVLNPDRAAVGSTESLTIATAGATEPDCSIGATINDVDSSPDGTMLAGAVYDREAKSTDLVIWSSADCSELSRWAADASFVPDIAWLPGGDVIASASGDGELRFWNAASGTLVHRMTVEEGAGFKMRFSDNGARLVTYSLWGEKSLRVFENH